MAANITMFDFESSFDYKSKQAWMAANWTMSFWLSGLYLLLVFVGRKWMLTRPGYRLQGALFAWNLALAAFSFAGARRVLPEVSDSLGHLGLRHSVCDPRFFSGASGAWVWLFALSKLPEMGDTLFLVLRKRPVRFLHCYHHVTVFCYCWYSYAGSATTGRWFVAMNYVIHALMYLYYAISALQVRLPALVSMGVTALQLSQMAAGCAVTLWAHRLKARNVRCQVTDENLVVSMLMYGSYLVLFAHLFYNSYLRKGKRLKKE